MQLRKLQHGVFLKKSPFLVVKKLNNEVRVYSRLHGNLTSFDFDINEVLKMFDPQIDVGKTLDNVSEICKCDPLALIKELYEKRFLIEGDKNEKEMLLEYVEGLRQKNKIPRISKITFLISAECNLACTGCYHSFYNFKGPDMKGDLASQILEGLFPYLKKRAIPELSISFLGYEPLLNFETLKNVYDRASGMGEEYNIKTSFQIFTNAFDLDENIFTWIGKNKHKLGIKVSLDGIKEDNDKRRVDFSGRGTYDRVVENLRRIIMTGVECGVLIVLSKLNFNNIEKFADEMAEVGVKRITANIFCGRSEDERLIELTESEKFEALKRFDLATERHGMEFDGEWKFAVVQMIKGAYFSCPAGIKQLVFSADGCIYPCQRFAGTEINFGKYKDDFWDDLMENQCGHYNSWMDNLYNGVMERTKEDKTDLAGWSCPFIPFIRGQSMNKNIERELNENLLEYYITRPVDRILSRLFMDC